MGLLPLGLLVAIHRIALFTVASTFKRPSIVSKALVNYPGFASTAISHIVNGILPFDCSPP
jgi:hypothetical protein